MEVIADLEVHSKYARAVSSSMTVPIIAEWATKKGIGLVGTGDFTHPMWLRELETSLEEAGKGVYRLKKSHFPPQNQISHFAYHTSPFFLLTSEVSCMYTHKGKGRRVHILVYLPTFDSVRKFNKELTNRGANLFSDGRPIVGLSLSQVAEIALNVDKKALVIPAHVWTPWFGFYGHMSGYDSLKEAFGDLEKYIPAVETGLSSDCAMNWRIAELENKRIVSFGDAHSPQKLGREATVFDLPEVSYENIWRALWGERWEVRNGKGEDEARGEKFRNQEIALQSRKSHLTPHISYTVEFYPEEGKYHFTGHRKCNVVYSPNQARKMGLSCPVCRRMLTLGVMSRVESLGKEEIEVVVEKDNFGVRWIKDKEDLHPKYVMLVPLFEILAESLGLGVSSQKVGGLYELLISEFGSEFSVLLKTKIDLIQKTAGEKTAQAVSKVRSGDIVIAPGFDGKFGKVKIWKDSEDKQNEVDQASLF